MYRGYPGRTGRKDKGGIAIIIRLKEAMRNNYSIANILNLSKHEGTNIITLGIAV